MGIFVPIVIMSPPVPLWSLKKVFVSTRSRPDHRHSFPKEEVFCLGVSGRAALWPDLHSAAAWLVVALSKAICICYLARAFLLPA